MKKIAVLVALALCPTLARAQLESFIPSKGIDKSSATVVIVAVTSGAFVVTDAPLMSGSDFVVVQSTYAGGAFCCSNESDATSGNTAGAKGCTRAKKDAGGGFWEMAYRRWWQNLRVYCKSLDANSPNMVLHVRQSK